MFMLFHPARPQLGTAAENEVSVDAAVLRRRWHLAARFYYKVLESVLLMEVKPEQQSRLLGLLQADSFHRSLFACCAEVTLFAHEVRLWPNPASTHPCKSYPHPPPPLPHTHTFLFPAIDPLLTFLLYPPSLHIYACALHAIFSFVLTQFIHGDVRQATDLKFPWVLGSLRLAPYEFQKVIEIVVRAETGLSATFVKHLSHCENMCLESLAWSQSSPLAGPVSDHTGPWLAGANVVVRNEASVATAVGSGSGKPLQRSQDIFRRKVLNLASARLLNLCQRLATPAVRSHGGIARVLDARVHDCARREECSAMPAIRCHAMVYCSARIAIPGSLALAAAIRRANTAP